MYNPNRLDRLGLAMLERERREGQTDRLVILPTARGYSGRGDQQRFAGRIMKSPREVLVRSIALSWPRSWLRQCSQLRRIPMRRPSISATRRT
jgi:hypothetical protein